MYVAKVLEPSKPAELKSRVNISEWNYIGTCTVSHFKFVILRDPFI